ncbi:hypothetical protein BN7_5691 [Wickerhamomyces ciferrii]|uniref:Uncharacterized protein n=1 Tax=Wickerhamomyces ciferrii (strain ATCC 14091 / BCRC 22168 / CBS 111 / JCM 3599 / NBRC 0793 / NRRL Y-1031 F-60-10) TaxID=1206466 RepID=K0KYD0_WICCF|nr:uncharacterized protein BN7_5691 [Wickerhamomyces ciferrii]CCH46103.1 hypothetical protein BN7_5691 [Wickerhamomyces ciferrii]
MSSPGDYFKLIQEDYQKVKHRISHKPMSIVQANEYFQRHKGSIITNFFFQIKKPLNKIRFWKIFTIETGDEESIVINQSLIYVLCLYITSLDRYNEPYSENIDPQNPSKSIISLSLSETCRHFYKLLYIFPSALVMNKVIIGDGDQVDPDDDSNIFNDVELQAGKDFISYNLGEVIPTLKNEYVPEEVNYSMNEVRDTNDEFKYKCHKFNQDKLVESMTKMNEKLSFELSRKPLKSLLLFFGKLLPPLFAGDYSNFMFKNQNSSKILYDDFFFDPVTRLFQFAMDDSDTDSLDPNNILNVLHPGTDNHIVSKTRYYDDDESTLFHSEETWEDENLSIIILHLKDQRFFHNVNKGGRGLKNFIEDSKIFNSIVSNLIKDQSDSQNSNYIIITDYQYSLLINIQNQDKSKQYSIIKNQINSFDPNSEPITPSSSDDETLSSGEYDLEVLICKNVFYKNLDLNEMNYNQINIIESRLMTSIFLLESFLKSLESRKTSRRFQRRKRKAKGKQIKAH